MIDVLIQGKVFAKPQERIGKTGAPFATAKLTAAAGDGESLFINCIAFDGDAVAALLALDAGDAVAMAGSATPKAWKDREGNLRAAMDVVVQRVLTAYHVSRKRKAMTAGVSMNRMASRFFPVPPSKGNSCPVDALEAVQKNRLTAWLTNGREQWDRFSPAGARAGNSSRIRRLLRNPTKGAMAW